jgi:hypothetical protein
MLSEVMQAAVTVPAKMHGKAFPVRKPAFIAMDAMMRFQVPHGTADVALNPVFFDD